MYLTGSHASYHQPYSFVSHYVTPNVFFVRGTTEAWCAVKLFGHDTFRCSTTYTHRFCMGRATWSTATTAVVSSRCLYFLVNKMNAEIFLFAFYFAVDSF